MESLLAVGVAVIAGLMLTRLFTRLKLPDVTAYLVAGVLIGPWVLGRLGVPGLGLSTAEDVDKLEFLSDIALGFIAFAIGSEFRLSKLREIGRQATVVGIVQSVMAALVVDAAMLLLHLILGDKLPVPMALTLGAIATATAPAATLMVVRQYKAKGAVTDILLPVVALDDAVGLVVFAVSFGAARAMVEGSVNTLEIFLAPLLEIIFSLVLGALMGLVLSWIEKFFNSNKNRLTLMTGFVLLTVGLAKVEFPLAGMEVGFSPLLTCMMLGTVFCNVCPLSEDLMEREERWTAPIYTIFFVLSGAALRFDVFADVTIVGIGVVYILTRCAGKFFGAWLSTTATHCDPMVRKWLGITLFPQAGVALGMCLQATELGEQGILVRNIILFSVLVYELVGPALTKMALTKAGDIKPKSFEVLNRRKLKLESAQSK
ncbi:MAG: cation:proton antiporter [Oscillospiraceae bacterium]|nr:cation:proton antiporter [Oscillospiraceae bacterium]